MKFDFHENIFDAKEILDDLSEEKRKISDLYESFQGPLYKSEYEKRLSNSSDAVSKIYMQLQEDYIFKKNYSIKLFEVYDIFEVQNELIEICNGVNSFVYGIVGKYDESIKERFHNRTNELLRIVSVIKNKLVKFMNDNSIDPETLETIVQNVRGMQESENTGPDDAALEQVLLDDDHLDMQTMVKIYDEKLKDLVRLETDRATQFVSSEIKNLESIFGDLKNLVAIAAGKKLGEVFEKNATKEEVLADRYRSYALGMMISIGILLIASFLMFELKNFSATETYVRVAIAIFFSFVVAYLVRQSAVHRTQQYMYVQKALDVTSISPYIADLPLQSQHEIKKIVAERIFVPPSQNSSEASGFITPEIFVKFLEKMDLAKKN